MTGIVSSVAQGPPRLEAADSRRSGASRRVRQRQFTLADRDSGILQRGEHICPVKIRIIDQNILYGPTGGQLANHSTDRHPHPTDARQATHLARIDGDALERHLTILRPARTGPRNINPLRLACLTAEPRPPPDLTVLGREMPHPRERHSERRQPQARRHERGGHPLPDRRRTPLPDHGHRRPSPTGPSFADHFGQREFPR